MQQDFNIRTIVIGENGVDGDALNCLGYWLGAAVICEEERSAIAYSFSGNARV
jgi:hypothetical protein